MQRKKTFVVVCVSILAITKMQAQPARPLLLSIPPVQAFSSALLPGTPSFLPAIALYLPQRAAANNVPYPLLLSIPGLARTYSGPGADYYTHHFGFFCQKELQLEKMTGIPFRFRLGSLEHCNFLEGK